MRPVPKILSASWGTEEQVGCPNGPQGLDNIPVTFNWLIRGLKIPNRDFQVIRSDGTVATPICTVGKTFVRVMWSNGLTAYPTGEEVGAPVLASYRVLYRLPDGRTAAIAPLEVADLHDHETSFNADNMHDLCLPRPPPRATLTGITIGADLIQDPDGDPNLAQRFPVGGAAQTLVASH